MKKHLLLWALPFALLACGGEDGRKATDPEKDAAIRIGQITADEYRKTGLEYAMAVQVALGKTLQQKIAKEGDTKHFAKRAEGLMCFNNMYIAALVIPILAIIPALIINYSHQLLLIFTAILALMIFRFFIIFVKIACLHCRAKYICPQAGQMGVREK